MGSVNFVQLPAITISNVGGQSDRLGSESRGGRQTAEYIQINTNTTNKYQCHQFPISNFPKIFNLGNFYMGNINLGKVKLGKRINGFKEVFKIWRSGLVNNDLFTKSFSSITLSLRVSPS